MRSSESAPNAVIRIGYLLAFFLPIITRYRQLYLPCLICFFTVGTYGFAYSYFPYMMWVYVLITLIALAFTAENIIHIRCSPLVIFVILYICLINLLDSGKIQDIGYSALIISMSSLVAGNNIKVNKLLLLNTFAIISITLSLIYLLNYQYFIETYNIVDDVQRAGWTDHNYLSCIIGMGAISSLVQLMTSNHRKKNIKIFWIAVIAVSFLVQLMMASRGGLLATIVSAVVILFYSNLKIKYKFLCAILAFVFCLLLYFNSFFDLLLYRIQNDTDGSGRLPIWSDKLVAFGSDCNIFQWLFGTGYEASIKLGTVGRGVGFHNDFLAILCNYGILGLFVFIYLLIIYPIKSITNNSKPIVLPLISFLTLACMTLEPISAGRVTYITFLYLIILCAKDK